MRVTLVPVPVYWQHIQQDVQHALEMMGDAPQTWWADVKKGYRRMNLQLVVY